MKRLVFLIVASLLCGGCFAMDEIEKGRELMEMHNPSTPEDFQSGDSGGKDVKKSARQRLSEYYARQRAKAAPRTVSDDPSDAVGACRIGEKTRFTRRSDCELRGGTFR
ncbi:MAG: hypothetical protein ACE5FL_09925 [Myxococcota bacterium]